MGQSVKNEQVRQYWDAEACGTAKCIVGEREELTPEWFARIEDHRYALEPFIHAFAQFTRHRGETVLEVGVGAGTDHLQWARAGAVCYGVDLTDRAIETTNAHLALYGCHSVLQRVDAEKLPFPDNFFDVVYSWGVIHHSTHPERIIREIRRVLKPTGSFIGMMYARRSLVVFKLWVKYALLSGRPWRSWADCVAHHMESPGTKAYTRMELQRLWGEFSMVETKQLLTPYDSNRFPDWISSWFPDRWGWFIAIKARK
ncbi:MAG TPA: class I SAM-dependent methyltransferase [Nitrospiraceae bacterium]|nr:class I SAM-dependent methyltransferase [Nitrospiraceae bacterium]